MNKELQDKAWKVLPKEFRENVKALYLSDERLIGIRKETSEIYLNRCFLSEMLFGKHNLTSDTDTEEMLTVSRRRVVKLYKKFNPPPYGLSRDRHAGIMFAIEQLFDSKCLLDESRNVASKLKFDVGDKVLIENDPRLPKEYRGRIGTVVLIYEGDICKVDVGNGVIPDKFHISHLTPYTEPKYKVGNEHKLQNERYNIDGETYLLDPRIQVAAYAMQGMLSNPNIVMSCGDLDDNQEDITKQAVEYADDLLKKCGIITIKKTEK